MRRILFFMMGLLVSTASWAVKANPSPAEVRQADGTLLTVFLHGDEDFHYYTTADGVLLVPENGSYFIARTLPDGSLAATGILAHNASLRTPAEREMVKAQDVEAFLASGHQVALQRKARREPVSTNHTLFPHTGSPKAIVILAEFKDTTFSITNPKRSFEDYFNAPGNLPDYGNGESANLASVGKYFSEVSHGQFTPQFDVYGPVRLPSSLGTYGGTRADGKNERIDLLMTEACILMDDSLDFSQYDSNNDGQVDLVIIIYAGYSQSMSGNSVDCIWPKSGTVDGGTYDGKEVRRYAVSAELNGFPGCWPSAPDKRINGTGTLCHEFCHTLGLPDFYPTTSNTSVKGDNQAMEYWSLMDSGNYNVNGYAPVALNAWEREAFGWIEIPTLTSPGEIEMKALDDGGTAYRILNDNNETGKEYFILENIQKIRINTRHRGHGLVVSHVEFEANTFWNGNANNIKGHPKMTIVPADGLLFAQYNVGKEIDGKVIRNSDFYDQLAGDPFPGTSEVTQLNDGMNLVNFQVYTGAKLNKALSEITEENGVVKFNFIDDFEAGIETASMAQPQRLSGIYTLDGRRVASDMDLLPKGIYIKNGRLVVK